MKYVKKPIVIDAFRLGYDELPSWISRHECMKTYRAEKRIDGNVTITISTLEGDMVANKGDYIIKGVQGELYPCKSDIFDLTYQPLEEVGVSFSLRANKGN